MERVIKPGTSCWIGNSERKDIEATVTKTVIHADLSVTYDVVWFDGKARNIASMTKQEIRLTRDKWRDSLSIGFIGPKRK